MTYIKFTSEQGVPFVARLVLAGGRYGLDGCLAAERPMIEFYDERHPFNDWLVEFNGQFASRYFVSTFLGEDGYTRPGYRPAIGGLCLEGGVRAWDLDAGSCMFVEQWLRKEMAK
jgi:hypothetical protein